MSLSKFIKLIREAKTADDAVIAMCELTENNPDKRRLMYVITPALLSSTFGESQAMSALNSFATFDIDSEEAFVRKGAQSFLRHFEKWQQHPVFIEELKTKGMAGFLTEDLLYVAHLCVKPDSKKYQVTTFGKNIGPLGDSQYDSEEKITDGSISGAGIPNGARYVSCDELEKVSLAFYPKVA